ncbi:MAG: squalene--hopene cyclase, partial [Gammaproteobacteria bacterium]
MNPERSPILADVAAPETITPLSFGDRPFYAPVTHADPLSRTLSHSGDALLAQQHASGHWRFDLEADTTIPAEYILLQHFMGTVDRDRESRLADYIRGRQLPDGSWPLYEGGPGNISATVKAYFAIKMAGEPVPSPRMQRARRWVLTHGGAENCNVFTRITLAVFGQLPWRTVPAMPAEMIWLPRWFYFNLSKVSYWSRCVIVPLLIIFANRPVHALAPEQGIRELFVARPDELVHIDKFHAGKPLRN